MTPIDFVVFDGDSSPNTPVREVADAMSRHIEIRSADGDWEILSYYLDEVTGRMILNIERKN